MLGADVAVVALPSLFDADRAGDLDATSSSSSTATSSSPASPAGVSRSRAAGRPLRTPSSRLTPGTLAQVLWHERPLRDAIAAGEATVAATRRAADRFLRLFPLPAG